MPDDELAAQKNRERERDLYYQYEWILADDLMGMRLNTYEGATTKVLVFNYLSSRSAILELDRSRPDGHEVHTNGLFVDWGDDFPVILGIMDQVMDSEPTTWVQVEAAEDDDNLAEWAATQPQDNYVNLAECGHTFDSPTELEVGKLVVCSVHGPTHIIDRNS